MHNTHGKLNFLGSAPHNTVANATYERLKHDIIFGKLKPGAKLKLETLKDEYAESLPILGKIWPIMNWLALNVHHNKNK